MVRPLNKPTPVAALCACGLLALAPAPGCAQAAGTELGGSLAVTSDYIYRGVSESSGQGALQADVHLDTGGGTFAGAWASSRDRRLEPGTPAELQLYLGQRFALGADWAAVLSGRADYFVGAPAEHSDDHQEISAALSWLDRLGFSLTAIPNAVRYTYSTYREAYYIYRSPAFVAESSGQWLLRERWLGGSLLATAGAGYYYSGRPDHAPAAAVGYLYGNAGLAFARQRWRVDAGYFATQARAAQLFPYPVANRRLAGTVSFEF
jgi:hypothetical protein